MSFHFPKVVVLICVLASCSTQNSNQILVATAANMQFAMKEIVDQFEKDTGIPCEIITGSSGKLTAQIESGAPFDVFVSADMSYPLSIYNKRVTELSRPQIYAYGSLVLWSTVFSTDLTTRLSEDKCEHIAVANPDIAPYGSAAKEYLVNLNQWDSLQAKFVYGESVSQTNQFIVSEVAEIGFTAKSVVLTPEMKHVGYWEELDTTLYQQIEQAALLLVPGNDDVSQANRFYQYLFEPQSQNILAKYGYIVP